MKRPAPCLTAGLLAAAALFLSSPRARARPPVPFNLDSHAFRYILSQARLTPVTSLEELDREPSRGLLIVFGDTRQLDNRPGWLRSFLSRGGAVFVATDRPWDGELGVRVDGRLVQARAATSEYRNAADCPILRVMPTSAPLPRLPIALPVATNRPSFLLRRGSDLTPFLRFPADCHCAGFPSFGGFPFGVGGTLGSGRALVLADHSIFINGMMLQPDNGNFDFAYACVDWLRKTDPPHRRRDRAMFVDDWAVYPSFDVPVTLDPGAGPSSVELANQLIDQLEQDDFLNRFILRNIGLPKIFRGVVVVATVLLLVYGVYRLVRAGYHPEPHVPLVSRRVAQLVAAPAVVDQRHQALLRQGNLWEAARDLARACFVGLGVPPAPAARDERPGRQPAALPRVSSTADWRRRRVLRQAVYHLWRLACNPRPRRVSRRRFTQLVNQVETVKAAVRDGTLRITKPGETP